MSSHVWQQPIAEMELLVKKQGRTGLMRLYFGKMDVLEATEYSRRRAVSFICAFAQFVATRSPRLPTKSHKLSCQELT